VDARSPDVAVLVSSCDAYEDLWAPFFTLFRRYWPDCPYPVSLGAESRTFDDPDVRPLVVGDARGWADRLAAMLRRLDEPYVLLMLEDYLLNAPVDTPRIGRLVDRMTETGAACMRLMPVPGAPDADPAFPDAGELPKGMAYRLSTQAAVWRRDELLGLLRPDESVWQVELEGTPRTNELERPFLSVVQGAPRPLPYFCTAILKGVWMREAVRMCRREGIAVDLTRRPAETRRAYLYRKQRRLREALSPPA
jgi:hypothetical protein